MFGKSDYVFLVRQNKILNDDSEKRLKNEVFSYINDSLKGIFFSKKIDYVDYYTSDSSQEVYSLMMTVQPSKENKLMTALLLEIYAFTKTGVETIFDSYKFEKTIFESEFQTIEVFKFKIKRMS